MNENQDNDSIIGLGPQYQECGMDGRHLIPTQGMLRFIKRADPDDDGDIVKMVCNLQQYQWGAEKGDFDWYDIPLVEV